MLVKKFRLETLKLVSLQVSQSAISGLFKIGEVLLLGDDRILLCNYRIVYNTYLIISAKVKITC